MKHQTTNGIKFKRLQRRLGVRQYVAVGLLESLWLFAQANALRGDVGRFSNEEIAAWMDYEGNADELVAVLVECGWLDACETHRLIVHDWHEHAPRFVKGNAARQGGFVRVERTSATYVANVHSERTSMPTERAPNLPTYLPTNQGGISKGNSTKGGRRPTATGAGAASPYATMPDVERELHRSTRFEHWRREWEETGNDWNDEGREFVETKLREEGFDQ